MGLNFIPKGSESGYKSILHFKGFGLTQGVFYPSGPVYTPNGCHCPSPLKAQWKVLRIWATAWRVGLHCWAKPEAPDAEGHGGCTGTAPTPPPAATGLGHGAGKRPGANDRKLDLGTNTASMARLELQVDSNSSMCGSGGPTGLLRNPGNFHGILRVSRGSLVWTVKKIVQQTPWSCLSASRIHLQVRTPHNNPKLSGTSPIRPIFW